MWEEVLEQFPPRWHEPDHRKILSGILGNRNCGLQLSMAIIKAPPKQPKSVTIQARVEESVKTQLDQYAKFIDSSPSCVIAEALKVLFKRDDEFKAWLDQHANELNREQIQGEALSKTA